MSKRHYADFEDEIDDAVYRYQKPRHYAPEHRVKKMRREREEGQSKHHPRRRTH